MKKDRVIITKAEKREQKKRPRMKIHGRSLLRSSKFAAMKIAGKKK